MRVGTIRFVIWSSNYENCIGVVFYNIEQRLWLVGIKKHVESISLFYSI